MWMSAQITARAARCAGTHTAAMTAAVVQLQVDAGSTHLHWSVHGSEYNKHLLFKAIILYSF